MDDRIELNPLKNNFLCPLNYIVSPNIVIILPMFVFLTISIQFQFSAIRNNPHHLLKDITMLYIELQSLGNLILDLPYSSKNVERLIHLVSKAINVLDRSAFTSDNYGVKKILNDELIQLVNTKKELPGTVNQSMQIACFTTLKISAHYLISKIKK